MIFAFGNKCAIIDTTPLNRWATCASALPTNVKFAWPHVRVNQKRAAYRAHTALECNSLFIVLTSELAAPLIAHSTQSTTLQVLA